MSYNGQHGSCYGSQKRRGIGRKNKKVINALKRDIKEEVEDSKKYMEQAKDLDSVGRPQDAQLVKEIGRQEIVHSKIEKAIVDE